MVHCDGWHILYTVSLYKDLPPLQSSFYLRAYTRPEYQCSQYKSVSLSFIMPCISIKQKPCAPLTETIRHICGVWGSSIGWTFERIVFPANPGGLHWWLPSSVLASATRGSTGYRELTKSDDYGTAVGVTWWLAFLVKLFSHQRIVWLVSVLRSFCFWRLRPSITMCVRRVDMCRMSHSMVGYKEASSAVYLCLPGETILACFLKTTVDPQK